MSINWESIVNNLLMTFCGIFIEFVKEASTKPKADSPSFWLIFCGQLYLLSSLPARVGHAQKSEKFDLIYRMTFRLDIHLPSKKALLLDIADTPTCGLSQKSSSRSRHLRATKNTKETEIHFCFFESFFGYLEYKKFRTYFAIWESETKTKGGRIHRQNA